MCAQVCETEKDWIFRKQQQKTSVHWTFSFFLIVSNSLFFFLHQSNQLLSYHRNTVFYSEIHLNKLLKDLYFLSHTLSGFVSITYCQSVIKKTTN